MHALPVTLDANETSTRSGLRKIDPVPDVCPFKGRDLLPVDTIPADEDPRIGASMRLTGSPLENDAFDLTELRQFDLEPGGVPDLGVEIASAFLEHTPVGLG